jgi:hypothetical protein
MLPGTPWSSRSSAESDGGTRVHAVLQACIEGREPPALTDPVERRMAELVTDWVARNRLVGMRSEVPFAYDTATDTARELVDSEGWPTRWYTDPEKRAAYPGHGGPIRDSELCGRADICYMGADDDGPVACVDDLKAEFGGSPADAMAQLAALGLTVARAYGAERARVRAIRVSETRTDDTSEVYWLSAFDMMAIGGELSRANVRGEPPPTPGAWCKERYCPAIEACPATQALLGQVVPAEMLVRRDSLVHTAWRYTPQIESADHLAWLVGAKSVVNEYQERVGKAILDYVANGAVTTTDGRVVEQSFRQNPRMDQRELAGLARSLGATDEQINACVHSSLVNAGVKVRKPGKKRSAA